MGYLSRMGSAFRDAINRLHSRDIAGAALLLRRAVEDDPTNADALTMLALIESDRGNREEWLQSKPTSPDAWYNHAPERCGYSAGMTAPWSRSRKRSRSRPTMSMCLPSAA